MVVFEGRLKWDRRVGKKKWWFQKKLKKGSRFHGGE